MISDIKTKILDTAQRLIQLRGYQGFSFNDLKVEVGITTASIHYHYPTKGDLGVAVLRRYRDQLRQELVRVAASKRPFSDQAGAIVGLFETARVDGCICLGSALAGEFGGLPPEVRTELRAFIEDTVGGLEKVLRTAQENGEVRADVPAGNLAQAWYAALQGSLTASRASDAGFLGQTAQILLKLSQPR